MSLTICRHLPLAHDREGIVNLERHQPMECNHRGSGRIRPQTPTLSHRGSGRIHPHPLAKATQITPQAWRGSGRIQPAPGPIAHGVPQAWRGSGRIVA